MVSKTKNTKKPVDKKTTLKISSKRVSSKRNLFSYEKEYAKIKNSLDNEDFNSIIPYLDSLEKKIKSSKNPKKITAYKIMKFIIFSKFDKLNESVELLEELDNNIQEIIKNEPLMYIDFTLAKSHTLWKRGKQEEALNLLTDLEKEFSTQELSNEILDRIGDLFNTKGIIYWLLGNVKESQNNFQSFLSIMGKVGNKVKFTDALNNLGNVAIYKGELNVALDLHLQALESRVQLGMKNQVASSLGNIAEIYHYKGEYQKSLQNYLQSQELFEETHNVLFLAKLYHQLITLHLEYDQIEKALTVLDLLKGLQKEAPTNDYIQMIYNYSQGLIFKTKERLLDKFHAAINFNDIVNGPIIDNEITVQAILNLTDILLLEIRLSNNELILEDINNYCIKIKNIATSQNSIALLIQGYLLESKLKLLDYKITDAKVALGKAIFLAQQHGIIKFEFLASQELDKLLQSEEEWEDLQERRAPLKDRLDLTGIEETLSSLTRKREEEFEVKREDPVLFIVLQKNGLPLFSSKFKQEIKMDNQLIGGFISAVNTFGQQIFSSEGQVERIKHGGFTLISQIVLGKFTFCYAFKGPSYLASKKMDLIIAKFLANPLKDVFLANLKTGYLLEEEDNKRMKDLVDKVIFLSEEKENEILTVAK